MQSQSDESTLFEKYQYQCWDGGPHIVLPKSLLSNWNGCMNAEDPLDSSTDYGRACLDSDNFGLIDVGAGKALVLGESPPMVAYHNRPSEDAIDLFILETWWEDLDTLLDQTRQEALLQFTGQYWQISDDELRLYYAGDIPSNPIQQPIVILCLPGRYEIWATEYFNDDLGEVVMIRLKTA